MVHCHVQRKSSEEFVRRGDSGRVGLYEGAHKGSVGVRLLAEDMQRQAASAVMREKAGRVFLYQSTNTINIYCATSYVCKYLILFFGNKWRTWWPGLRDE